MTTTPVRYFTPAELSAMTGLSVDALAKLRQRRSGPPWVGFGRSVRYPSDLLRAWTVAEARKGMAQPGEIYPITRAGGQA